MRDRKVLVATLVVTMLVGVGTVFPSSAQAVSCAGQPDGDADFAANNKVPGVAVYGTAATVQAYNPALCTGTMPTFSSAWVAIDDGGTGDRLSILQIGFDKCRDTCDTGTAENNLYVFWAYGRNPGGPCGAEIGPVPKFLQNSPGGSPRFKIQRAGADLAYHYELYMDNVLKAYKYIGDVEVCWPGGAIRSSTANEVFDLGTQSGGKAADRQDFIDVRYRTGNTWSLWSRTLGADCDLIQRTTQDCITSTTDSNNYYSWDTRF